MENYMIVGTYSDKGSKGIYVFSFDSETGEIKEVSTQDQTKNPSYLTVEGDMVYAISESGGEEPGTVSAYRFDKNTGELQFLSKQETGGDHPCYVEAKDGLVAVANYSGGSASVFKMQKDGDFTGDRQVVQHQGGSIHPDRQQGPHVHQSIFSPDGRFLLTPDLGKDRVMVYAVSGDAKEPLTQHSEIFSEPGSGPRHMAFHPRKNYAYLILELNPVIHVYSYDDGHFTLIQELPSWKEGFEGGKDGAAIKVSADGKFLYVSNRGDQNVIGIYEIDQETGKISNVGYQSVNGKGPRDFEIDPSGNFLVVANQQTDNLVIFKRDKETGLLTKVADKQLPIPVCVKFISR